MNPEELTQKIRSKQERREVEVPGLGTMWVRQVPASALVDEVEGDGPTAELERCIGLIIAGTVDADGVPSMTDTPEWRASLRELTDEQLTAWFTPILELCGIDTEKKDSAPPVSLHTG